VARQQINQIRAFLFERRAELPRILAAPPDDPLLQAMPQPES
jgi:hypothetical protein